MRVQLLFRMGVDGSNEKMESAFLQYMDVTNLIDKEDETLRYIRLKRSTDGKVYHTPRPCTGILEQMVLSLGEWCWME